MKTFFKKILFDRTGAFKLKILTSPLFLIGLAIKLAIMPFFASSYFSDLFVPFIKYFALTGNNPYVHFQAIGMANAFPYPSIMLYLMALPGIIFRPLLSTQIFAHTPTTFFLFHLPILAADIVILLILSRWLKNKERTLLILYWLSPVLFFINYLHSQLDALPIALVFIFLYFLFKERLIPAVIFLGLAIAAKFNIIILVPLTFIYLWRTQRSVVRALLLTFITGATFLIVNIPYLFTPAFYEMVFSNSQQFKIFNAYLPIDLAAGIYLAPFAYMALVLHSATFKFFSRDVFVMFLGFSFGILTLFIAPMPGWYYWIIPFLVYFYVKYGGGGVRNLWILSLLYFVYLFLAPQSDLLTIFAYAFPTLATLPNIYTVLAAHNINASLISNLAFAALQATLLMNLFWLYRRGVETSTKTKLYTAPYLIGVAGDSGSGKTTFTNLLMQIFGSQNTLAIAGDGLHKWERGNQMWQTYTHLDPHANHLYSDIANAQMLQSGSNIYRRSYDHQSGTFTAPHKQTPKKIVLFEGLHTFFLSSMRGALDLKVFITPDEDLRTHWKIARDTQERAHSKESVLNELNKRKKDAQAYIETQEAFADIVFAIRSRTSLEHHLGEDIPLDLFLECTCDNAVPLDAFIEALQACVTIEHYYGARVQTIRIHGALSGAQIEQLSYSLIPELYDIVVRDTLWSENEKGLIQLFTCYYIFTTLKRHV